MALNIYNGQRQPIQLALTTGPDKTPINANTLTRASAEIINRTTGTVAASLDSASDANTFYWTRVSQSVKNVEVFLLELEFQDAGIPVGENYICRITLYDALHPLGIAWKQFAVNVR